MNNKKDVKELNIASVLQCIKQKRTISKGRIAAELGITSVTSHKLVSELCESGLVCESGEYVSYGGKRAALYRIDNSYGLIIGITVKRNEISVCLSDIGFDIKEHFSLDIDLCDTDKVIEKISIEVKKLLDKYSTFNILGIGISIPGRSDETGDKIYIPGEPEWDSVPLASILKKKTGLNVFIDNDANALALSVKWQGMTECSSFVCAQIRNGIGIGVISRGELFKSADFRGIEIGHITLDPKGERCSCGKRGCLQTFVDENKVLRKIRDALNEEITYNKALELLKEKNDIALKGFEEYFEYLRITAENIITIFAPEVLYIYNEAACVSQGFEEELAGAYFPTAQTSARPEIKLLCAEQLDCNAPVSLLCEQLMKRPMYFINNVSEEIE